MEPVTSMSPARNSWYLVQAMAADAGSATSALAGGSSPQSGHPGVWGRVLPGRESHDLKDPAPCLLTPPPGRAREGAGRASAISRAGAGGAGPHRVTVSSHGPRSPHLQKGLMGRGSENASWILERSVYPLERLS